ncbi:DUF4419 domain-containing protein [Herpetosiphon llansteffanensis]
MTAIAPILAQRHGSIQFVVDAVEPCQQAPACQQASALPIWQGLPTLETIQTDAQLFAKTGSDHPLLSCLELAYGQHYPLVLTPDCIWLTITQGFSLHLNQNYQQLRQRLVQHSGKKSLHVDEVRTWPEAIERWVDQLTQALPKNLVQTLQCDFSTTTPTTRIASQIVLLESFQAYFEYEMTPICGIPNITLLGTPADWRSLAERVQRLAVFDLAWWTERLAPICEGLILTSEGQPPHSFWQQIYHKIDFCGTQINGWITDLFPYIKHSRQQGMFLRNPLLKCERQLFGDPVAPAPIQSNKASLAPAEVAFNADDLAGIEPFDLETLDFEQQSGSVHVLDASDFTTGLAKVSTIQREHGQSRLVKLMAGLLGTSYDPTTKQLRPEIGWAVYQQRDHTEFWRRMKLEHQVTLAQKSSTNQQLPAMLADMFKYFASATLFAASPNPCYLLPQHAYQPVNDHPDWICFAKLGDGREIYYHTVASRICWVILVNPNRDQAPVVIATSIAEFFQRLLGSSDYYFDQEHFRAPATI